jgi:hypothetical protein
MLVSALGTALGAMQPGEFVEVRVSDGDGGGRAKAVAGGADAPGIYLARADAPVVLRSSPHYTTLMRAATRRFPRSCSSRRYITSSGSHGWTMRIRDPGSWATACGASAAVPGNRNDTKPDAS